MERGRSTTLEASIHSGSFVLEGGLPLLFPIASITVADRQRKTLSKIDELADSIRAIGLINPITITESGRLIAGERRLTACKQLGWTEIPANVFPDDERTRTAAELAENVMREDMPWPDQVLAAAKLVEFFGTVTEAASFAGYATSWLSRLNSLAPSVRAANQQIMSAAGINAALNILERQLSREMDAGLNDILSAPLTKPAVADESSTPPPPAPPEPKWRDPGLDLLTASFLEWAPAYAGRRFNFLHVDFPYGINIDKSDQLSHDSHTVYADTPELFWALSECLRSNIEKILFPFAHIMFWYSAKLYTEVFQFWNRPPFVVNPTPLIWLKSDNAGVLADPKRGPRNIYETALMMTIGDRLIVKAKANAYSAPTAGKALHLTEKPEPVLRHFFEMFVDPDTELFDPTCGSGSSLRAAESLGAKRTMGLELDPEVADRARGALRAHRILRSQQS
jgi:ParB/RepB/Spo0J family partition protein